ncbi:MAG: hypothetical protein CYPHOPRED_001406 [Cyphobasidiales sp. Tagirdzhanova-0007]|nr:MAG: hypothetical protein CYPHOPRED_001406 [Cyphobasidiales sp. Tagirdzhanova-0007]
MPGLGPRAQGRHPRSKASYLNDPTKMRYFVAPDGWLDEEDNLTGLYTSPLKPYVYSHTANRVPEDWPQAATGKPEKDYDSQRQGIYGPKGFDGAYYLQLAKLYEGKKPA